MFQVVERRAPSVLHGVLRISKVTIANTFPFDARTVFFSFSVGGSEVARTRPMPCERGRAVVVEETVGVQVPEADGDEGYTVTVRVCVGGVPGPSAKDAGEAEVPVKAKGGQEDVSLRLMQGEVEAAQVEMVVLWRALDPFRSKETVAEEVEASNASNNAAPATNALPPPLPGTAVIHDDLGFAMTLGLAEEHEAARQQARLATIGQSKRWLDLLGQNEVVTDAMLLAAANPSVAHFIRGEVWLTLSGARRLQEKSPGYYQGLVGALRSRDHSSPEVQAAKEVIIKDLGRTFPGHRYFTTPQAQEALLRLLQCFAIHNPTVGYRGSMNFLAAVCLSVSDESNAFWLLRTLVEDLCPAYFVDGLVGVHRDQKVLDSLLAQHLPQVSAHLAKINCPLAMVTSEWFIALYATVVPSDALFHLWDRLFALETAAPIRFALALLEVNEQRILACPDFRVGFKLVKALPNTAFDVGSIFGSTFWSTERIPAATIESLRKKFTPEPAPPAPAPKAREAEREEEEDDEGARGESREATPLNESAAESAAASGVARSPSRSRGSQSRSRSRSRSGSGSGSGSRSRSRSRSKSGSKSRPPSHSPSPRRSRSQSRSRSRSRSGS
jgi:hypothetical protein